MLGFEPLTFCSVNDDRWSGKICVKNTSKTIKKHDMGNRLSAIKHDTEDIGFKQTNELKANIKTEQVNIKKANVFFFLQPAVFRTLSSVIFPIFFSHLYTRTCSAPHGSFFHFVALW